ncbi:MAG: hypothetical protein ACTSO9_08320 [Candidatus Helarchaeota archaeon]
MVDLSINNRWKLILYCTLFNLLFEYSMRGINDFGRHPLLIIVLFFTYFSLFTILEDLILRYKLRDYHIVLLAFFYGTIYLAFASGFLFAPPLLFGINYFAWFFVNFVWWGIIQGVLTFYIANRITARDWNHPTLGKLGWILTLIINGLTLFIFQLNPLSFEKTLEGIISMCILLCIFGILSYVIINKSENEYETQFEPSKIIDILLIATTVFFAFCSIFLIYDPQVSGGSYSNKLATLLVICWTSILGIILIIHRIVLKKPIPI